MQLNFYAKWIYQYVLFDTFTYIHIYGTQNTSLQATNLKEKCTLPPAINFNLLDHVKVNINKNEKLYQQRNTFQPTAAVSRGVHDPAAATNAHLNTPRMLELDINRMLIGQNQIM